MFLTKAPMAQVLMKALGAGYEPFRLDLFGSAISKLKALKVFLTMFSQEI